MEEESMEFLWEGLLSITWQQLLMYVVGGLLIWLAIEKGFEPALLLPMGFGAILVNLPLSGVINQFSEGVGETHGIIQWLFEVGIEASEAFPILLFIGIGAMIDFGPLLANPKLILSGAAMRMPYRAQGVSKRLRILFPIVVSVIAGLVAPSSVALVGFLMFGNLIRECGVLTSLSQTAQNELANLITLLLGITIAFSMKADQFVQKETIMIMGLGLVAFVLDSMVGVLFVKVLNIFTPKNKINPMVGAAGISAFPMSSRVIEKLGQEADSQNHLLMHAVAANVSGQIASVVAGGVVLQYFANNPIL